MTYVVSSVAFVADIYIYLTELHHYNIYDCVIILLSLDLFNELLNLSYMCLVMALKIGHSQVKYFSNSVQERSTKCLCFSGCKVEDLLTFPAMVDGLFQQFL